MDGGEESVPYGGDVVVASGVTLSIQPGVQVIHRELFLDAQGTLNAVGMPSGRLCLSPG